MSVSLSCPLILNFFKGCKDDQDFSDFQLNSLVMSSFCHLTPASPEELKLAVRFIQVPLKSSALVVFATLEQIATLLSRGSQ